MKHTQLIEVKPHSLAKYNIVRKYINACYLFDQKYHNVAYIDTHGGSGKIKLNGDIRDGSPLLASKIEHSHIIEIDPQRVKLLKKYFHGNKNIKVHLGDCNQLISSVLDSIPERRFIMAFVDPEGFVYKRIPQLLASTLEQIGLRSKSEVLVNFMVGPLLRMLPGIKEGKIPDYVTPLVGTDDWKWYRKRDNLPQHLIFHDLFIENVIAPHYKYITTFLVYTEKKSLQYSLIHATNNQTGNKIMSNIFTCEQELSKNHTLRSWI